MMHIVRSHELPYLPASHEDPNKPGVLKRILAEKSDFISGRVQMINWARLPIGQSFQRHFHEDMQEAFILVTGEALIHVGNESSQLSPGDLVMVPPGVIHMMTNIGKEDVQYIVVGVSTGQGGKTIVVSG